MNFGCTFILLVMLVASYVSQEVSAEPQHPPGWTWPPMDFRQGSPTAYQQQKQESKMPLPRVTLEELSDGIANPKTNANSRKVLEGIANDYMDLLYGVETPYTTGKQVIPSEATLQHVDNAIADSTTEKKFKDIFEVISETEKSGDLTPKSENDGSWDPKFKPVLVLITPNT